MKFNTLKYCILFLFVIGISINAQEKPEALFQLGRTFEQTGNYQRAKEFYQRAYNIQPFNLSYLTSLNNVFIILKEYDNSIQLLDSRLSENPNDLNSISLLGTTYFTMGDTTKAYEVWEGGLSSGNNAMARYRVIVNTVIENRAFNKAIEYLKRAKKMDFSSPVFALDLAYIYSITMNYKKAAVEYLNVLKLHPDQIYNVINRMSRYLNKPGAINETISTVEDHSGICDKTEYYELLTALYKLNKNYSQAFEYVKKLDTEKKRNGDVINQFAAEALRENNAETASEAYKYIIDNYPESPVAPFAKAGFAKAKELSIQEKIDSAGNLWKPYSDQTVMFEDDLQELIKLYNSFLDYYGDENLRSEIKLRVANIYKNKLYDLESTKPIYKELLNSGVNNLYRIKAVLNLAEIDILENNPEKAKDSLIKVENIKQLPSEEKDKIKLLLGRIEFWQGNFESAQKKLSEVTNNLATDDANDALQLETLMGTAKNDSVSLSEFAKADLYVYQRRFEDASGVYKALAANDNLMLLNETAELKYAEVQIALDKYPEALTILEGITSKDKLNIYDADAEFLKGEVYFYALKDYEGAMRSFRNVLENYSSSLYLDKAREKINYIKSIKDKTI